MKRNLLLISLVMLILGSMLLSSCAATATPTAAGTATPVPTEAPKEVSLLLWDKTEDATALGEWTRARQEAFAAKYPYIKIDRQAIPVAEGGSSTPDRVAFTTAMAAGTGPSAYQGGHFPTMQVWIAQGFALPLDAYAAEWADYKDIIPATLTSGQADGKTYGIPAFAYVMNFAYRKDLYTQAGLDPEKPPKTWDEMIANAKLLTKADKSQYGLGLPGKDISDWWFQFYVWQAGGDLSTLNADKTVTISLNSIPVKTALQLYKDLKWTYDVMQSDTAMDFGTLVNDFATGKCAQILYTGEWYSWTAGAGLTDDQLGMGTMPIGPAGNNMTSNGGAYWFINPTASKEQQDASWEYIKFMNSKEAMIEKYKFLESKGFRAPIASFYSDIKVSDYIKIPEQWAIATTESLKTSRAEYALVDLLRPYVNKAIETILTDKTADISAILDTAQENAQKDVIDGYNAGIKK